MHRSLTTAALLAALCPGLGFGLALGAEPAATALDDAKARLGRGDAQGAVSVLESSLHGTRGESRLPLLDALREAYPAAIRQAESQGSKDAAEAYRDNLEILGHASRSKPPAPPAASPAAPEPKAEPAPAPTPAPIPAIEGPKADAAVDRAVLSTEPPAESVAPLPAVAPLDAPPALAAPEPVPAPAEAEAPAPPQAQAEVLPTTPTLDAPPMPSPTSRLKLAVEAFKAENYDEAGRIFAELGREGDLPAGFKSHWAYCRAVEVVRRINARPDSPQAWASIDAEIKQIRELSPSDWYPEYLRNLAGERNRNPRSRAAARSNGGSLVLRGNSPEEPPLPKAAPAPIPAQAPGQPIHWSRQPVESANFVVIHVERDRALAEQAARAAEAAREASIKRWGAAPEAWSPRCELILFPGAAEFARETLQPADSPGFSTMGMNGGRIVLRRVHLRVDHPNMVKAILPHEVTHVVLADLFPTQQIPRWADEGMAVLAEPPVEQATRAADLDHPLKTGRVFRVGELMAMDYPRQEYWGLYYAQSVSLTRFLVETGTPAQFVKFVQHSQRAGIEPALKQVYSINGFAELQDRWAAYARRQSNAPAALTASSETDGPQGTDRR